ncbi:MAG: hypothetical protein DMF53_15480 [Acidobacteria bacterium]|nr:MAG: hypothetical protein DMF53_15480 [Acidobacteriota bacterium]
MIAALSFAVLASALATPPPAFFAKPPTLSSAPALCSTAAAAPVKKRPKPPGGLPTKATCTADCGLFNSWVSCSGSTCSAVNQDQTCPAGPGYVNCDGNITYCAPCCTEGTIRIIGGETCSCPDGQSTPRDRYKCINGLWEYQTTVCGAPFCIGPQ